MSLGRATSHRMKTCGTGAQAARPEFLEAMAGNAILPGMDTAAHCYCGHQFGNFAGQLGDGAVIYLGEVSLPKM